MLRTLLLDAVGSKYDINAYDRRLSRAS